MLSPMSVEIRGTPSMASLDHDTATAQLLAAANWPKFLHCWSLRKSLLLNHPNPTCNLTDWV